MEASTITKQLKFWNKMPSKTVFILISGKAGVGKNLFGQLLSQNISSLSVQMINFADSIKRAARKYFGWNNNKDSRGRHLLQQLGGVGREYDENIWVKNLIKEINEINMFPPDVVVISDWRFPNEAKYLEEEGYQVVKIKVIAPNRETLIGTRQYIDTSETSLDFYDEFDYVIDNDTITYEELNIKAKKIIRELFYN